MDIFGKKRIAGLEKKVGELQAYTEVLIGEIEIANKQYKGNPYQTYRAAVDELSKKYEGKAFWGNQLTQNIIEILSSFIMGSGIKFYKKYNSAEAEKAEAFVKNFFEANDLDEEIPVEFCKESLIEGKFLCKLIPNKDKETVEIRHISFTDTSYKIETEQDDYKHYTKVIYKVKSADKTLNENEFVYKRFGGRLSKVNDTPPKLATILRNIEDLDKALWDLRKINHLFASPTPTFECETKEEADNLWKKLKKVNWKIGKLLISTAKFNLVEYSGAGKDGLITEIETQAKIISGTTGVPVHFLGLPNLLSNRATAENMMESLYTSTAKDRKTWIGAFEEIISKALVMANKNFNQNYPLDAIGVQIPFITAAKMKELVEIWLPLYTAGVITLKTMLSKVPEVDETEEENSLVNEAKKTIAGGALEKENAVSE